MESGCVHSLVACSTVACCSSVDITTLTKGHVWVFMKVLVKKHTVDVTWLFSITTVLCHYSTSKCIPLTRQRETKALRASETYHGSEFKNWNFSYKPFQAVLYYTRFQIYLCSCGNDKWWTSGTRSLRVTAGCINLIYILPPWEKSFDFMEAVIRRLHALWVSTVLWCGFTQHTIWLLFKS